MTSIFKKLRNKLHKEEQKDVLPPDLQVPANKRAAVSDRSTKASPGADAESEIVITEEFTGEHQFRVPPGQPPLDRPTNPSVGSINIEKTDEFLKLDEEFERTEGYNPYDTNVGVNKPGSPWDKLKKR